MRSGVDSQSASFVDDVVAVGVGSEFYGVVADLQGRGLFGAVAVADASVGVGQVEFIRSRGRFDRLFFEDTAVCSEQSIVGGGLTLDCSGAVGGHSSIAH